MWQNYLTVALRTLAKNKTYAAINILGLDTSDMYHMLMSAGVAGLIFSIIALALVLTACGGMDPSSGSTAPPPARPPPAPLPGDNSKKRHGLSSHGRAGMNVAHGPSARSTAVAAVDSGAGGRGTPAGAQLGDTSRLWGAPGLSG